ncbi:MAG: hypothetical protein ACQETK_08025, partial [Pseudomonadota bacterium]
MSAKAVTMNTLVANPFVRRIVQSGSGRKRTNRVSTMAISIVDMATASQRVYRGWTSRAQPDMSEWPGIPDDVHPPRYEVGEGEGDRKDVLGEHRPRAQQEHQVRE